MVKSLVPLPRGFFLLCYQIDPYMELCRKWEKGDGGHLLCDFNSWYDFCWLKVQQDCEINATYVVVGPNF